MSSSIGADMTDSAGKKKVQGDDFAFLAAIGLLVLHVVAAIIIANWHLTLLLLGAGVITVLIMYLALFLDSLNSPSLRQFQTVRQATGLLAATYGGAWVVMLIIEGVVLLENSFLK